MSTDALGWQDEHLLDERRRRRNGFMVSAAIHGLVFATLAISPSRHAPPLPAVLSVDLVAAPPAARASRPRSAPKAATPKPAPPPPEAAPPPPPPPPPIAKAPVQVLPENSPNKIREVKPPQQVARKKEPEPRPRRRPKAEELSYEDAMAALGDELGPEEDPDLLQAPAEDEPEDSTGTPAPRAGVQISKEMGAWITATTRRIQNNWKGLAGYQGRGLVTTLEIELSATGKVLGTPRVMVSSGDPYFDDNAVRAVKFVDPLPAPPRAGVTMFNFRSEEY